MTEPARRRNPSDGWVTCSHGHRHWGLRGAAGLLLVHRDDDGQILVLLQHRAPWVHQGDTWSTPGGARHTDEPAVDAAFREVAEETGMALAADADGWRVIGTHVDDHGGWSYSTVCAVLSEPLEVSERSEPVPWTLRGEQQGLRWLPLDDVDALPLHPGFASTWPLVRGIVESGAGS
jgi:8-oxo-dGTP pyrophosphatase MutT (NUDIX family)